jgi:hypothetical protein
MSKLPYAETVNYWETSRSSADSWIDKAKKEISQIGGRVIAEAFGSEPQTGRSAFMLAFDAGGQHFKIVWPVLSSKTGKDKSARIQAATFLYHDVKAKCMVAKVFGVRKAFFEYLMLPDGRVTSDLASDEMANLLPDIFNSNVKTLKSGDEDITDGEFREVK